MPPSNQQFQAVLDDATSDAPRLAYAAAFDNPQDPRAQFIRLQIEDMAAGNRPGTSRWWACEDLLRASGVAWAADVAPLVRAYNFERGFVGRVKLSANDFLRNAAALFAAAPIIHMDLTEAKPHITELCASPHLSKIRSLSLAGCALDDNDIRLLASSPHLSELRWLSLMDNRIAFFGADQLAASKLLPNLHYVEFSGNPFNPTQRFADDSGIIVDLWMPPEGEQLEQRHGMIRWLHIEDCRTVDDIPPDRYRVALRPAI